MLLQGRKILVTRPVGQADKLLKLIQQQGGEALHYAVMEIVALDEQRDAALLQQGKQQVLQLDQYQHIIFISTNAVQHGMEWVQQYWPQLPVGIDWYGIGKQTCQRLAAEGVVVNSASSIQSKNIDTMNSEALLQQETLQQLNGQKVLIVRGVGGREHLAEQLAQRGAQVDYLECYRRQMTAQPDGELGLLISQQQIDTICVNSGDSLHYLLSLCGQKGKDKLLPLNLVVPSERVASIARQEGFERLRVAANASDQAVVETLLDW